MKLLLLALSLCVASTAMAQEAPREFTIWGVLDNAAPTPDTGTEDEFALARERVPPGMDIERLVTLTSDKDDNRAYLHVMLDKETRLVTGIYNLPDKRNRQRNDTEGRNVIPLREIESASGAVMLTSKGYKVLILMGKMDQEKQEGKFKIKYLTNGLFNTYKSCDFHLKKKNGGAWFVQNAYSGSTVNNVKVLTSALGVKTLQGICP